MFEPRNTSANLDLYAITFETKRSQKVPRQASLGAPSKVHLERGLPDVAALSKPEADVPKGAAASLPALRRTDDAVAERAVVVAFEEPDLASRLWLLST